MQSRYKKGTVGSNERADQAHPAKGPQASSPLVTGLALLFPAVLCGLTELLIPTVRTSWLSLQEVDIAGRGEFVGLDNYATLFGQPAFGQAVSFTLTSLLVRLIVVAIVPLALAWAVARLGRPLRLAARIVLTVPIALFVPIAIALAWTILLYSGAGPLARGSTALASPSGARTTLVLIDALYLFGLACGLGLIFFLPIWRHPKGSVSPAFPETLKPLVATWAVGILATIALSLSTFTLSFALTSGGPDNSTSTLGLSLFRSGFAFFKIGPAASLATIILLVTLALGLAAGLLILLTRLRLSTVHERPSHAPGGRQPRGQRKKGLPAIVLVLALLLALGACSLGALAFAWLAPQSMGEGGFGQLLQELPVGRMLIDSIIPPFLAAVVQLLVAYLAALSIGALQPFGKRSEWLLLAFSPWLFATVLPLSQVSFMTARQLGTLDSFVGLISPLLFSVAALFVLTLFFRGKAPDWRDAVAGSEQSGTDAFFRQLILPSLPLAGLLLLFLFVLGWQEFFWPFVASTGPEHLTLSVGLLRLMTNTSALRPGLFAAGVILLVGPMSLFFFVTLAIFQVLFLDRLVLYSSKRHQVDR